MKNIMYFLDYGRAYGGAAHTLMQQAILMRKNGYKINVVISNYYKNEIDVSYQRICDSYHIFLHKVPFVMSSTPEDINYIEIRNHYSKVKELIESCMPDILHSVQINVTVELVSRELKIPHIMNIYQAKQSFFPFKYLDIFPRYHLCDSELYRKAWSHNLGCHSCCVRTYAKHLDGKQINKRSLVFLCVGAICERKNQLEVIKAFEHLTKDKIDARLILCGDDNNEYGAVCRDYVAENQLSESVKFAGFCVDINEYYINADILVCGSKIESYPNVVSEALASDCVVVSTPVGGVPEVIKDEENGYLCDGFDYCSIAEKMKEAVSDYFERKGHMIRQCAQNTYQQNHSENAVYHAVQAYYGFVLNDYQRKKSEQEIKYEDLKMMFGDLYERYCEYTDLVLDPLFISYKLWYLYHIGKLYLQDFRTKPIYLWGTDWATIVVVEMMAVFFPQLEVSGFIGNDHGALFLGKTICSPETVLSDKNSIIFIATEDEQEFIERSLESHGKKCGQDYFMMAIRVW